MCCLFTACQILPLEKALCPQVCSSLGSISALWRGEEEQNWAWICWKTVHPQAGLVSSEFKAPPDFSGPWVTPLVTLQLKPTLEMEISQNQKYFPKFYLSLNPVSNLEFKLKQGLISV